MSAPQNYHEIPEPSSKTSTTIRNTPSAFSLRRIAELWRPDGSRLETVLATLARVSLRLVDRTTGIAYSADELEAKILGEVGGDADNFVTLAGEQSISGTKTYMGSHVYTSTASWTYDAASATTLRTALHLPLLTNPGGFNATNTWTTDNTFEGRAEFSDRISFLSTAVFSAEPAAIASFKTVFNVPSGSGTNTGDQTSIVGIIGTKNQFDTALTNDDFAYVGSTNTFVGTQNFADDVNVTGLLNATSFSGTGTYITGIASGLTSGNATKAGSLSVSGQTGLISLTGTASNNRVKTVRDAADTILELAGSYTPTGTWTNMQLATPNIGAAAGTSLTNSTSTTSPIYAMAAGGSIRPNGSGSTTGQVTVNTTGDVAITSATGASGAASGALQVSGGMSVGQNLFASNLFASASNAVGIAGRLAIKSASDGNATVYANNQTTVANLTINNLTANGTATVAGQVELTGQAAASSTSAMTRSLMFKEQMLQVGTYRPIHNGAGDLTNSGSGSTNVNDNLGVSLVGSTTASAWQRVGLCWVMTGNPGASGAAGNAAIPLAVAFNAFCYIEGSVNSEILCVVGEVGGGAPMALGSNPLAGRGFGFRIYWSAANSRREIEIFTHDGTTYTHSNTSSTVPFNCSSTLVDQLCSFLLASNANGTVKLFANVGAANGGGTRISETPLITWTGGPISGSYANKYISAFIRNGATPPTLAAQCKILNAAIHTGETY